MANSAGVVSIYPAGRGRFALGSPDGKILQPGQQVKIMLAGHLIVGTIQVSDLGDYLRAEDGTICGLCASMRVVAAKVGIDGNKLGAWVRHDRCWIDQQNGEALVGHHFALFRLSAASLPDFLQPAVDGTYEYSAYDGHVLREEEERARWIMTHWHNALVAPALYRCIPTEQIDRPVHGLRYRAMVDDEGIIRWIDASILEVFAPTLSRLATYRFEVIEQHRFRVYAPDDATPIAVVSERVKEVAR